jgi:hypothetical protein
MQSVNLYAHLEADNCDIQSYSLKPEASSTLDSSPVEQKATTTSVVDDLKSKFSVLSWSETKKRHDVRGSSLIHTQKKAEQSPKLKQFILNMRPCCKICGIRIRLASLSVNLQAKFQEKLESLKTIPICSNIPHGMCATCKSKMPQGMKSQQKQDYIYANNMFQCRHCDCEYQLKTDHLQDDEADRILRVLNQHYTVSSPKIVGLCKACCQKEIERFEKDYQQAETDYQQGLKEDWFSISLDDEEHSTLLYHLENYLERLEEILDSAEYVANFSVGLKPIDMIASLRFDISLLKKKINKEFSLLS